MPKSGSYTAVLRPRAGLILRSRAGLILRPRAGLILCPRAGLILRPRAGLILRPRAGFILRPSSAGQNDYKTLGSHITYIRVYSTDVYILTFGEPLPKKKLVLSNCYSKTFYYIYIFSCSILATIRIL